MAPLPPTQVPDYSAPCSVTEESCCPVSVEVSFPLVAKSIITNSLVPLVQSTVNKQMFSQKMCDSSTCNGGMSVCKQVGESFQFYRILRVDDLGRLLLLLRFLP